MTNDERIKRKELNYNFKQCCMEFVTLHKHYVMTAAGALETVCITNIQDNTQLYMNPKDAVPFEVTDSEGTRYDREQLYMWILTMFGMLARQEQLRREFMTAKMGVDRRVVDN